MAQGVGTALVLSCAPALATLLVDESRRTQALGAYSGALSFAGIAAPLIGGASIAVLGWSGVFWFRVPLALAALVLMPVLVRLKQPPAARSLRTFQPGGPCLLAIGIGCLLLTPSLVSSDASPWMPALAGTGFLAAFALHQSRAHAPMLPPAVLRDPAFVAPNLASILVHFVGFAVPLLVPYQLARIGGLAATEIGAVIALSPAGMLLGSVLAVPLARRAGSNASAWVGGVLVAGGGAALALCASSQPGLPIMASLLLHGTGLGLFQVAYTDSMVAALPRHARGVAGSLTMVTRTFGVVTAAAALTGAVDLLERRRIAAGDSATAALAAALETVFGFASAVLGMVFLAGWLLGLAACSRKR
jgi:predicted MFS family arabinose efflux permease